jgi:thiol-disulfide isomerase/thioredoxin
MRMLATQSEMDAALFTASSEKKLLVLEFTASWCGPCQKIAPAYEALAAEFPQVIFAKVDATKSQEMVGKYRITVMPTFKGFCDHTEVFSVRGANEAALRASIAQHACTSTGGVLEVPLMLQALEGALAKCVPCVSTINQANLPEGDDNARPLPSQNDITTPPLMTGQDAVKQHQTTPGRSVVSILALSAGTTVGLALLFEAQHSELASSQPLQMALATGACSLLLLCIRKARKQRQESCVGGGAKSASAAMIPLDATGWRADTIGALCAEQNANAQPLVNQKKQPSGFVWARFQLKEIASCFASPVRDVATRRKGVPLFHVTGACPADGIGPMQAMLFAGMYEGSEPASKSLIAVDFWWVKPMVRDPSRVEYQSMCKQHDGPHKNVPSRAAAALYAPIASLFQSRVSSVDNTLRFSVDWQPEYSLWRAVIRSSTDGNAPRFLLCIWLDAFNAQGSSGRLVYQRMADGTALFCCPFRLSSDGISLSLAEEEPCQGVMPSDAT